MQNRLRTLLAILTVLLMGAILGAAAFAVKGEQPSKWFVEKYDDWLGFVGGIVGGVMTLLAALIAWISVHRQIDDAIRARDEAQYEETIKTIKRHLSILNIALDFVEDVDVSCRNGFRNESFDNNPALQRLVAEADPEILQPCIKVWRLANGIWFVEPVANPTPQKDLDAIRAEIKAARDYYKEAKRDLDDSMADTEEDLQRTRAGRLSRYLRLGPEDPSPNFPI